MKKINILFLNLVILLFLSNCDDYTFEEKYPNPIGAINITSEDNLYEMSNPIIWSPNSNYIVYTVDDNDPEMLGPEGEYDWFIHIGKKEINNGLPLIYHISSYWAEFGRPPTVSSDSEWFIYTGEGIDGGADINKVLANNPEGPFETLTYFGHTNIYGRPSPDDKWIAFVSDREPHFPFPEIYIMPFDGETPDNPATRITYQTGESYYYNLLWSSDSNWIIYTYGFFPLYDYTLYKFNPWNWPGSLVTINIANGIRVIPLDWSPDGKWISVQYYFEDEQTGEYQARVGYISSEAGKQEIHDFFPPLPFDCDCFGVSWSPDGEWVAFVSEMENPEGYYDIFLYPFEPED